MEKSCHEIATKSDAYCIGNDGSSLLPFVLFFVANLDVSIFFHFIFCEKEEIDHEFGHLIEYQVMALKEVDEYKKYPIESVCVSY